MKKYIILIFAIALSHNISAQENLSVKEYRQRVLDYSLQIKQSKEAFIISESDLMAAKKNLLPKLDAAAEFSYLINKINFDLGAGQMLSYKQIGYGISATAAQNVYSGGIVRKQIGALKINKEIAGKNIDLSIENISYAAEMSYWRNVAMIEFRKVAQNYYKIIKETYDIVSVRYEDGLISRNDLLMVETRLAESEYRLRDVQKLVKEASISMNILMGISPETDVILSDSLVKPHTALPEYISLDDALLNRPDYAISQQNVKAASQGLKITKSAYLPKLAVGVTGQFATPTINLSGKGIWNAVAFAQLKVPIFSWNERKYKIHSSQAKIRASEYERLNTIDEISKEVSLSWSNLKNTFEQIESASKSLSIAEQSLELNTYSYTEGVLTILDVLSSQLSWLNAYNDFITTHFNYVQAQTSYKKAIGFY